MKKIICFLMTITLTITMVFSTIVYAEQNKQNLVVESNQGIITVQLDGKNIEFDVAPQIINERTMVPLRAIFEALGATVDWKDDTQTVTSTKGDTTISLAINNPTMYVNGTAVTLDSPACLVDGRTLVPVRAISESFDIQVEWKEVAPPAVINYDDISANVNQINDMIGKGMYLEAMQECKNAKEWHSLSPLDTQIVNDLENEAQSKYNSYYFYSNIIIKKVPRFDTVTGAKLISESSIPHGTTTGRVAYSNDYKYSGAFGIASAYCDYLESLGWERERIKFNTKTKIGKDGVVREIPFSTSYTYKKDEIYLYLYAYYGDTSEEVTLYYHGFFE